DARRRAALPGGGLRWVPDEANRPHDTAGRGGALLAGARGRERGMNEQQTRGTVLIVDDHSRNRALLAAYLASVDCEVQEAADGYEALAMIHAAPPDVILLDVMMPGLDGYA